MAITTNTTFKNTILDGFDTAFNSGTLEIRTGSAPGAGNSATGTVLATITLPADAFAAASGGTKAKSGTWNDTSADATGTAGHWRMTGGSNIVEGTVTATSGGGDMELDSTSITSGQTVTITAFTFSV
ncbi:MAG: hypothetical protein EKK62_16865 [Acidimicrobiia bacterium]|nr:MAG: hypothetical protein EKK62_16865 [Acidimicrobiia bacterium]